MPKPSTRLLVLREGGQCHWTKKMLENDCGCGSIDIALDKMTTNLKNAGAILISPSKFTLLWTIWPKILENAGVILPSPSKFIVCSLLLCRECCFALFVQHKSFRHTVKLTQRQTGLRHAWFREAVRENDVLIWEFVPNSKKYHFLHMNFF